MSTVYELITEHYFVKIMRHVVICVCFVVICSKEIIYIYHPFVSSPTADIMDNVEFSFLATRRTSIDDNFDRSVGWSVMLLKF